MMHIRLTIAFFALLASSASTSAALRQDLHTPNRATVRLKPSAFANLPATIREYLERRGCEIPQSFTSKTPHNIIRGRFTTATQIDIAVLCSKGGISTILVFRGRTTSNVAELAPHPDETFMQVVDAGGVVGYSRALGVANSSHIRQHNNEFGGPKPPPVDHDGLEDMFGEKPSVIWYWYRGQWLQLQGSD